MWLVVVPPLLLLRLCALLLLLLAGAGSLRKAQSFAEGSKVGGCDVLEGRPPGNEAEVV